MGDVDYLQQILQGQAALQDMVRESRDDIRLLRTQMSEYSMDLTYARAEIKHLRDDHENLGIRNEEAHAIIRKMIEKEVQTAWDEKRRCAAERRDSSDRLMADLEGRVALTIERVKGRFALGILVYALSVIGFFIKEMWFK